MPNLWLSFDPPHLYAGIVDSIRKKLHIKLFSPS